MTCTLDRALYGTLVCSAQTGDAIRQDLAAIVDETLENANIAIIDIRDPADTQRICFLLRGIALRALIAELRGPSARACTLIAT